jgi:hypothetical protein
MIVNVSLKRKLIYIDKKGLRYLDCS